MSHEQPPIPGFLASKSGMAFRAVGWLFCAVVVVASEVTPRAGHLSWRPLFWAVLAASFVRSAFKAGQEFRRQP